MAQLKLVRKGENFKVFTDGTNEHLMIERVRISFPAIGTPKKEESDDGGDDRLKYKSTPMLPKATHKAAKDEFIKMKNALQAANDDVKIPAEYLCIKDGDREGQERDEYKEHWVIACSDTRMPIARDRTGALILDPEKIKKGDDWDRMLQRIDEIFYGGVTVNIMIRPWFFNGVVKGKTKKYPKRICAGITGIQHVEDTPSFGQGRIDDTGAWGDTTDGEGGGTDALDDDPDGL